MGKTIFQKIIDREIDADIVFENDNIIAFNDINPVAPVHVLIVTKKPIESINFIEKDRGVKVGIHFEDDPIQIREISKRCPEVKIVHLVHTLVEKENKRRPFK